VQAESTSGITIDSEEAAVDFPKIELIGGTDQVEGGALALGFFQSEDKSKSKSEPPTYLGKRTSQIDALVQRLLQSKHFNAKRGESDLLRFVDVAGASNTLLLGLGVRSKLTLDGLRRAGATLYQTQKRGKFDRVAVPLESIVPSDFALGEAQGLQAFLEGYLLASYQYSEFKASLKDASSPRRLDVMVSKSASAKSAVARAEALARSVCFARLLGDKPGNALTPTELAKLVSQMAKQNKIRCTVWNKAQIEKAKMGLFMGVAKGSDEEPRFILLEYRGGKKTEKPIALVGKGITFDSGGISIKPAPMMEEMKYDMMGAATVAAVFQAAAELKLPVNLNGYIAAAENMPSGTAQKPGDIRTSSKGKTVEIVNTDAEGRLILADALEYAQQSEPQAIFDFATLTGAVLVALGSVATGIMGNSPELIDRLKKSGEVTGEKVWELPLFEEYEEDMKSHYADYRNSGSRDAGSSKGGTFLKFFVDPKFPWVHCDIAGTAWNRKDVNYHPSKNASGAMVLLMAHLLENWSKLEK
jgi:leucyl aminopeptidase